MLKHTLSLIMAAGLLPAAFFHAPAQAQNAAAELVYQVQQLQEEVRQLRGLVEQQTREIDRLRQRQRDQYLDLDQRLRAFSSGSVSPAANPPSAPDAVDAQVAAQLPGIGQGSHQSAAQLPNTPPPVQPAQPQASDPEVIALGEPEVRGEINTQAQVTTLNRPQTATASVAGAPSQDEQGTYDSAFDELKALRYDRAADGFRGFIARYANSRLVDNAQYWLGESYYGARNFTMALQAFRLLLEQYPDSGKRPDALLKVGYSHYELRQWAEARAALEQVQNQYPDSTIARLAENRLRTMRLEGHY